MDNLTGKYIMELSKLKHLQCYTTNCKLDYRKFNCKPQRHQLSTIFQSSIEEVFEALEKVDVDMSTAHSIIKPIFNQFF